MKRPHWRSLLILGSWLALIFYSSTPHPTAAHAGGTPLIVNEPAGPFLVSIWSLPNPVVSNEDANLIVALASPSEDPNSRAGLVVLNADIEIELTDESGWETVTVRPNHDTATNKLFYEAYFEFPNGGMWTGEVTVAKDGDEGTAVFSLPVEQGESTGLEINWMLVGGTAVLLIGLIWFVWQSRTTPETTS